MIIDFHTHIFHESIITQKTKYFDDPQFKLLYENKESKLLSHKMILKDMASNAIDAVIAMGFNWEKEKYCEEQNDYFSKVITISQNKIIPFGSIPSSKKSIFTNGLKI